MTAITIARPTIIRAKEPPALECAVAAPPLTELGSGVRSRWKAARAGCGQAGASAVSARNTGGRPGRTPSVIGRARRRLSDVGRLRRIGDVHAAESGIA